MHRSVRTARGLVLALTCVPVLALSAQPRVPAAAGAVPRGMSAITRADLERDLYTMAGDGMRGREAGTPDEMRASMWVAEQLRSIGVKPVGQDGTYFQWFNMVRTRVSTVSTNGAVGDTPLTVWTDFVPLGSANADVSAPVVWLGDGADSTIDVRGKIAAIQITAPPRGINPHHHELQGSPVRQRGHHRRHAARAAARRRRHHGGGRLHHRRGLRRARGPA